MDWDEDNSKAIITSDDNVDGAIYSKENLEINGDGALYISSPAGHGIKTSDNLTIENGYITIDAASDGIHINYTFKMSGGNLSITSDCDGIDSEAIVIISGGEISVKSEEGKGTEFRIILKWVTWVNLNGGVF